MVDLQKCPESEYFPVARELAPARLRSSRNPMNSVSLRHRSVWFWGCCAPRREQAPSPQIAHFPQEVLVPRWSGSRPRCRAFETTQRINFSAARKGRRFVLCLPLETL
ncbi:hypothetical protein FHG55_18430 [Pseudomonas jessenii]|uniref:Uncharacterized protein n=1 Tax=Pseudomonas jessenii TaxID=77298 RepID=A0A5C4KWT7_PSEJE|nr:hypothetical protein FHG55_18430 [Pseudomonas jessenii]